MVRQPLLGGRFVGGAFGLDLRLERRVATSPRSDVWAAVDPRSGRAFAVKVRPRCDRGQTPRLLREAACLARLDGRGIPRVVDVMVTGHLVALAMPFVPGRPLSKIFPGWIERSALVSAAIAAVAHVHRAGWVHDRLGADNLLCDRTGRAPVLLTGFSSARALGAGAIPGSGTDGASRFVDDPSTWNSSHVHLAPERASRGPSTRVDVFALGRTLLDHLGRCPSAPREGRLLALLESCVALDPTARPRSALELQEALGRVLVA